MQLYFSPFACSLASHATARAAGVPIELVPVSLATKRTAGGDDFLAVTPKGQVPALRLDDGTVLTENPAVLQYLADRNPGAGLLPPPGAPARYAVLEWVGYVSTELHKACYGMMFNPESPAEAKAWARAVLDRKLAWVASVVGDRAVLVGDRFTIADAYMGWALELGRRIGVTLPPALERYRAGIVAREPFAAAVAAEEAAAAAAS